MAYPAADLDPLIAKRLDMGFSDNVEIQRRYANAAAAGDDRVAELNRNIFLQMTQLYQANAAQQLQTSVLAREILQQRSAGGQPQASAADAGVSGGK